MSTSDAALESAVEELVLSAASRWPTFVFRGVISLFFGILFLVYPDATLFTITRVFGAFLIIDGIFCFFAVVLLCRSGAAFRLVRSLHGCLLDKSHPWHRRCCLSRLYSRKLSCYYWSLVPSHWPVLRL